MKKYPKKLTFGEWLSDKITEFGGSWTFIIGFISFQLAWMLFNVYVKPLDPYPFMLWNLILSTVAALQAPIIMMSQNRTEAKDRQRAVKMAKELDDLTKQIKVIMENQQKIINHLGIDKDDDGNFG